MHSIFEHYSTFIKLAGQPQPPVNLYTLMPGPIMKKKRPRKINNFEAVKALKNVKFKVFKILGMSDTTHCQFIHSNNFFGLEKTKV